MRASLKLAWLRMALPILVAVSMPGCSSIKTIVVPVGEPFVLTSSIPGPVKALIQTPAGEWIEGEVQQIPAGWACWYPSKGDFGEGEP